MNTKLKCGAIPRWLLLPAAALLAWPFSGVLAQEQQQAVGPTDEVIVTGSRIRQNPLDQKDPVLTITEEELRNSGFASVGDYLNRLTIAGSPLNTRFNSSGNFGFPPDGGGIGAGATQADLRHLGCKRVLVLVDGQRWINGSSASGVPSCVDLNTIPISVISRIEVLENGASPIYGSDAISGVINIITKSEIDGIEVSGYAGVFNEGDGNTQEYSIAMGSKDEDSSTYLNLSYYNQDSVSASDRSLAQFPVPHTGVTRGSSGTPQGRFDFSDASDPNCANPLDPLCNVIDVTLNNGVVNNGMPPLPTFDPMNPNAGDFHNFATADRFNFAPYNLVVTPSERWNIFAQANRDLGANVRASLRGSYTNRKSTNQAAPEPIFIGAGAGTGALPDTISVDITNPYNPFGQTIDALTDPNSFIGRRPIEGGPRVYNQNVDTWFMNGGLQGEFSAADKEFFWDVNASWAQNTADQLKMGGYNAAKMQTALGPVSQCTGACVPLNLFGGQGAMGEGSITQAMLDYIGFIQHDQSEQELVDFTANLTGPLFAMPAGEVNFAFGFEHREETGSFTPDPIVVAGDTNGVPSTPTSGGYNVDEVYVEFAVPLLADRKLAEQLDVNLAVRNTNYDFTSSESRYSFGAYWRPASDLSFRANYSEGFRGPGIGELFGNVSRFDATLTDPCSDFNNTGVSQTVITNCIAQGVPADGSYVQFNPQISISTGGNPNLSPEDSETTTAGFVYSPAWAEGKGWTNGLTAEVTYYDITVDGAIQALDAQTQLDNCAMTNDPTLCNGISRTAAGIINGFNNQLTNIGKIDTDGWDVNLTYLTPEWDVGAFQVTWLNTFVSSYQETALGGTRDLKGVEENDSSIPEWKSTMNIDWMRGNWAATWTFRYIDSVTESCSDFLDGSPNSLTQLGLCSNANLADETMSTNDLGGTTYSDVQVRWRPEFADGDLLLSLGIQNIFDRNPPPCYSCSLNGYDPSTYDPQGSFGYIQATYAIN